jgi:hypothetical protein
VHDDVVLMAEDILLREHTSLDDRFADLVLEKFSGDFDSLFFCHHGVCVLIRR